MRILKVIAFSIATFISIFAVAGDLIANPDSPGRQDLRYIVGLVPNEEGFEAFWIHDNQFVNPVLPLYPRLLRTRFTAEGLVRESTLAIREALGATKVDGQSPNLQVLWTVGRALVVSPIVDGVLKFPEGKFVAAYADFPDLICHRSECVASWNIGNVVRQAVVLDANGNPRSAPFSLPDGFPPSALTLDESGIFYVRHTIGELRAALISRDGTLKYDVSLTRNLPLRPATVATAFNGSRHVVVFVEPATNSLPVRAVAVSDNGSISEPITLIRDQKTDLVLFALAWNGNSYLLAGSSPSFIQRFDAELLPIDPSPRSVSVLLGAPRQIRVVGTSFAIGWNGFAPFVTVVSADGQISPPTAVDALPRRRNAVRH